MSSPTAEVRLGGGKVGTLTYDRGGSRFVYEDDLLSPSHRVLGQTFEDDPHSVRRARTGLPAWFANLLPEGELRRQVVAEMGGGPISDYRLLARLGADLPGAVTVRAGSEPDDSADVTALDQRLASDHPLRYSLAGVQLKYSVHSSHLTVPAHDEDQWWIVKLPDRSLPMLAANEFLTMRWLRAAGMHVPRVELVNAGSVGGLPAGFVEPDDLVYLIARFDRLADGRVHFEDFAQLADVGPEFKYGEFGATYDSMGVVIKQLLGDGGFDIYLERLVAMVITGNTDAHLKNWALCYSDGRTPTLSPIYDFHSLTVYSRFRYAPMALSLAGEQMSGLIERRHVGQMAESCGSSADRAVEVAEATVARLREAWTGELARETKQRFPALADHYSHRLASLPIANP